MNAHEWEHALIRNSSELKVGMVVWHVYGHLKGSTPTPEEVLELNLKKPYGQHKYFRTQVLNGPRSYGQDHHYYGDCGLDGVDHNRNRLFKTRVAAEQFLQYCTENKEGFHEQD